MFQIYQTRPILAWSLTVLGGLFLLWAFWPRRSATNSGGTTVASVGYGQSDAATQAQTQYAIAQLNAQQQSDATAAAVAVRAQELAVQEHIAEINANTDARQLEYQYNLQTLGIASAERITDHQLDADLQGQSIAAAASLAQQQTAAQLQAFLIASNAAIQQTLITGQVISDSERNHVDTNSLVRILGALPQITVPNFNPGG